jgi:putative transposase
MEQSAQNGAQISMAAIGNVYENALTESFFATLKREEVYLHDYQTFAEAAAHLEHFIDAVYNHKRLHSSLGYRPPNEFETHWLGAPENDDFIGRKDRPYFGSGPCLGVHLTYSPS